MNGVVLCKGTCMCMKIEIVKKICKKRVGVESNRETNRNTQYIQTARGRQLKQRLGRQRSEGGREGGKEGAMSAQNQRPQYF